MNNYSESYCKQSVLMVKIVFSSIFMINIIKLKNILFKKFDNNQLRDV